MTDQAANLLRVSNSIAPFVESFLTQRINEEFFGVELYKHVVEHVGFVAPDSPRRVMSDLRSKGVVNYELVSKPKSLFRALPVSEQLTLFS